MVLISESVDNLIVLQLILWLINMLFCVGKRSKNTLKKVRRRFVYAVWCAAYTNLLYKQKKMFRTYLSLSTVLSTLLKSCRNCTATSIVVTIVATISDIGKDIHTPSTCM